MKDILVPIFICCVLPVSIVLIIFVSAMYSDNKRAKVLIKAIESGNDIDTDKLAEALRKPQKSPREILNGRLLKGCIFSFIGIILAVIGLVNYACNADFESDAVTVPLIFGGILFAIGMSFLVVFFFTRKQIEDNIQ